jgi:leucyl-tRNA synthetase
MDGFACSSWYFLRFASPRYDKGPVSPEALSYWLPVDLYVGGAEHAVMHLLYARFWAKVMYDAGLVQFDEPFQTLKNQGMLLGEDGRKMSKSLGNIVTPDETVARYGSDALRLYILFVGPFEVDLAWQEAGIAGVYRFLKRVWAIVNESLDRGLPTGSPEADEKKEIQYQIHKTIKKVSNDIDGFEFNTAVACLMEYVNYLYSVREKMDGFGVIWQEALQVLVRLLSPMTPFLAEELWERLGFTESVHTQTWLSWNEEALLRDEVLIVVQINGKVRDRILVPQGSKKDEVLDLAMQSPSVQRHLGGASPDRVVYVSGRLLSLVST